MGDALGVGLGVDVAALEAVRDTVLDEVDAVLVADAVADADAASPAKATLNPRLGDMTFPGCALMKFGGLSAVTNLKAKLCSALTVSSGILTLQLYTFA